MAIAFASVGETSRGESFVALPRAATNRMSLQVQIKDTANEAAPVGAYCLRAFGRDLLADSPSWHRTNGTGSAKVVESAASNSWEYLRLDLSPAAGPEYAWWHRHLLFVAPDLFAILDEAKLATVGQPRVDLVSPGSLMLDPRSRDFRLETKDAGMTAHVFASLPAQFDSWKSNSAPGMTTYCWQATNRVDQFRILTLIIPHAAGKKGGTGFKLMESDTAIGARVWRNGSPTLIAFRTAPSGEESVLASMPVTGPVAVDVFDPELIKKRRVVPQPAPGK